MKDARMEMLEGLIDLAEKVGMSTEAVDNMRGEIKALKELERIPKADGKIVSTTDKEGTEFMCEGNESLIINHCAAVVKASIKSLGPKNPAALRVLISVIKEEIDEQDKRSKKTADEN